MPREAYVFAQFLRLLPRYEFQRIVDKYNGDYRTRQFKCWHQLACMMFAHIRQENSLRDIDIALNAHAGKLYHIGIQQCPRSTLADANERRDYRIYEEFAKVLMHHARREYADTQLSIDVDNAVYALDASVIDLTLSLFPWAKFRKTKGAVKLHAMIDLRGNIPAFLTITDGKVHDVKAAPQVPIEAEGIYVVDRGYVDFAWLWLIHQTHAFFVTRLKTSIKWTRVISHPVDKSLGLRSDQEILVASTRLKRLYPERLRRISFRDDLQGRTLVFLTNNFTLPAETIAALYKARWEIEPLFQMDKAKSPGENFLRHLRQRSKDTNLDCHGRLPRPGHSETALSPGYEPFQVITLFGGQSLCSEIADFYLPVQRTGFSPGIRQATEVVRFLSHAIAWKPSRKPRQILATFFANITL